MDFKLCGNHFETIESLETFIKTKPFHSWWDKELFISTPTIRILLYKYCADYFLIWWDKTKVDWDTESDFLCLFASEHFNIWWDKNKFNYDKGLFFLSKHCHKHFKFWIDEKIKIIKYVDKLGKPRIKVDIHENSFDKFKQWFNKMKSIKSNRRNKNVIK